MESERDLAATHEADSAKIEFFGHHLQLTDGLKNHARDKLHKVIKLFNGRPLNISVTFDQQKLAHTCSVSLKEPKLKVRVTATSTDMYTSIDEACRRLEMKVLRYKDRIKELHHKAVPVRDLEVQMVSPLDAEIAEINAEISNWHWKHQREQFHHPVIESHKIQVKTLSLDEAVLKMDLSGDAFMLYHPVERDGLRVIYRRKDGNYAVLEVN